MAPGGCGLAVLALAALLLCIGCMARSASALLDPQEFETFNHSLMEPVNTEAAASGCPYGELQGTWMDPPQEELIYAWDTLTPHNVSMMPFETNEAEASAQGLYGSRWQVLDSECQLRNLIRPYLAGEVLVPPAQAKKILVFGDSTDTHMLNYFIDHMWRVQNNGTSQRYKDIFQDANIKLHDRGPDLNHIITNSGLVIGQMFLLGVNPELENPDFRVECAREQWTALFGPGVEPDIIVFHNLHWTLYHMSQDGTEDSPRHPDYDLCKEFTLPPHYVKGFMYNMSHMAHQIRKHFPGTLIVAHTAVMPRHNMDGHTDGKRAFINRMFTSQLNEAQKAVARQLRMPIIDWDHITRGMVPNQVLFDDIHPAQWISFEFFNVLLNILDAHEKRRSEIAATWGLSLSTKTRHLLGF